MLSVKKGTMNFKVTTTVMAAVVAFVFIASLVAFTSDSGLGNIDSLLGQYSLSKVAIGASDDDVLPDLVTKESEQSEYDADTDTGSKAKVFDMFDPVEFDQNRKASILPRTVQMPYNNIKYDGSKQYFLYSPSGGFNNQILCMLSAIFIARENNYTLIVPPGGKHSNFEMGYYKQPVETTVPMDQLLDLDHMSKAFGIEMVPINGTLAEFHVNVLGGKKVNTDIVTYLQWPGKMKEATEKTVLSVRRQATEAKTPIVFAKGRWYSGGRRLIEPWFHAHVRYSPYLLKLSYLISKNFFNNDFDAFHVRLGDYSKKAKLSVHDGSGFVNFGLQNGFSKERPVYIATDGDVFDDLSKHKFSNWFSPFRAFKKVIPETRLAEDDEIAGALIDFRNRLPNSDIYRDMFGLVEQLVCARARTFVGTSVSTFTKTIVQKRVHLKSAVPDMTSNAWPWTQGKTFTIRWNGRMVFHALTQNLTSSETFFVEFGARKRNSIGDRRLNDAYLTNAFNNYFATLALPEP